MNRSGSLISQLFSIRNRYGKEFASQKLKLLAAIANKPLTSKGVFQTLYDTLLFLLAYPDNPAVYQSAGRSLNQLQVFIQSHENIRFRLYNSGITGTQVCAAFSFEIVKWVRINHPTDIRLNSFEADDAVVQSILSVVMPKVESEIFQDGNAGWRSWFKQSMKKGEDLLDRVIAVFDETDIRPEVKDELWNAMGLNVEIDFPVHDCLPVSLFDPYYHRSLIRKKLSHKQQEIKYKQVRVNEKEAEQIIDCSRMILIRHLREIDPITFTSARLVSYYQLDRGLSVALMGMVPDRRHPVDSYMGYVVFKNGLPVAYAGSWILFDSARIGLNIFPSYRGGESQYIFSVVMKLHQKVYRLNRFSVDPYQIGKDNSDGIQSGAFWVYYHAGFRPMQKDQQMLAAAEAMKIKSKPGYRSPAPILKKLADSRMEIILKGKPVRFDATDLSRAYAAIIKEQHNNKRNPAEEQSLKKLAKLLQIKNYQEEKIQFILKNWCILLFYHEQDILSNSILRKTLKKLFEYKATGSEEDYITGLQRTTDLRKLVDLTLRENTPGTPH
jgi:hypothetical protein